MILARKGSGKNKVMRGRFPCAGGGELVPCSLQLTVRKSVAWTFFHVGN